MEAEPLAQATNHDRQDAIHLKHGGTIKPHDAGMRDRATDRSVVDETTLEQLQKDMGDAFLLCRSSKALLTPATYRVLSQIC